jgi:hypothetical protein
MPAPDFRCGRFIKRASSIVKTYAFERMGKGAKGQSRNSEEIT